MNDPSGQGFWNWFALISSLVADYFTFGGSGPETAAQLGTTGILAGDASAASTIGAVVHMTQETDPKGQTQPAPGTQPPPPSLPPILCQPSIWKAMQIAYEGAKAKNSLNMASSSSNRVEGGFQVYSGPAGAPAQGPVEYGPESGWDPAHGNTSANGLLATFHSHTVGDGLPSTPSNTAGNKSGDTGYAQSRGADTYVISSGGLAVAHPNGPRNPPKDWNPWVVQGNGVRDWLKKLKSKCAE